MFLCNLLEVWVDYYFDDLIIKVDIMGCWMIIFNDFDIIYNCLV